MLLFVILFSQENVTKILRYTLIFFNIFVPIYISEYSNHEELTFLLQSDVYVF